MKLSDDDDDNRLPRKKLEVRNPSVGEWRSGSRKMKTVIRLCLHLTWVVQRFSFGDPSSKSQNLPFSISKDVLPENQMYFVPLATTVEPNVCVTDTRIDKPAVGLASQGER